VVFDETQAALVSLVLPGGFSVCAGVDRESVSKINMSRFSLQKQRLKVGIS
jgi:hypothetical protein